MTAKDFWVILGITMPRNTVIVNFSTEPKIAQLIEKQAKIENKSKSQLLREAFLCYTFNQRLTEVQKIGEVIAQKLGLESYDDIEKYVG